MWAIASGIEGNLAADEAVVADLRKSRQEVEFKTVRYID
jgi:hypothetical protein